MTRPRDVPSLPRGGSARQMARATNERPEQAEPPRSRQGFALAMLAMTCSAAIMVTATWWLVDFIVRHAPR